LRPLNIGITLLLAAAVCAHVVRAAASAPFVATLEAGPTSSNSPLAQWGAVAEDQFNHEWLWFGGQGGVSREGALRTWIFRDNHWTESRLGDAQSDALLAQVKALQVEARDLYAATANRYYESESEAARGRDLAAVAKTLLGKVSALTPTCPATATDAGAKAGASLAALSTRLAATRLSAADVAAARDAWMSLVRLEWAVDVQPSVRAYASMAYEPETRKIVLFGGEGMYGAYADTWVYDCPTRRWSQAHPALSPSPRVAHGMVAAGGKVYLVGGQEPSFYPAPWWRLPTDVWVYDVKASSWTLIRAGGEAIGKPQMMQPPIKAALSADGAKLSWTGEEVAYWKKIGSFEGSMTLPGGDVGTAKAGVPPGTLKGHGSAVEPSFYEAAPPVDAGAFQAFLSKIPVNRWTHVKPPVLPRERCWGTTTLDLEHDQLLHWAGGHSSHCGTDVAHFSLQTGRWHILFAPELPFEYCLGNDGAMVPSQSGRPWASHTYLSYGWDQVSKRMIWAGMHRAYRLTNPCGVFTYDPERYAWDDPAPQYEIKGGWFFVERHLTCMARTPHGLAVWANKRAGTGGNSGLWLADVAGHAFQPVAATDPNDGTTLPSPAFGDAHGMTYDSKRDRVLIFNFDLPGKYKIWACELKTGVVTVLEPKGSTNFPMTVTFGREATYLPEDDLVLICTCAKATEPKTLLYDCAANEWLEMPGKPDAEYYVSTGIEWDPKRKLLWLVLADGSVYAMRFDRASAGLQALR
jgi:hypothetical protein